MPCINNINDRQKLAEGMVQCDCCNEWCDEDDLIYDRCPDCTDDEDRFRTSVNNNEFNVFAEDDAPDVIKILAPLT